MFRITKVLSKCREEYGSDGGIVKPPFPEIIARLKIYYANLIMDNFLEVAATLVDLLFIELMLYLSHLKQIYIQPIHSTH